MTNERIKELFYESLDRHFWIEGYDGCDYAQALDSIGLTKDEVIDELHRQGANNEAIAEALEVVYEPIK